MVNVDFTTNKTPKSNYFDDIYYNVENGLAEKEYVFIKGNDLANRFKSLNDTFRILELGFGTGLTFLLTVIEFLKSESKGKLIFTSTELYPLSYDEINNALLAFPDIYNLKVTQEFLEQYKSLDLSKNFNIVLANCELYVLVGDVEETLAKIENKQHCFFLDGFAPSKNPKMWSEITFSEIARLADENSTFSTYSASRVVKDIVELAGFSYTKEKGFGKKRDMLVGIKK